jgi:hypothetical protein
MIAREQPIDVTEKHDLNDVIDEVQATHRPRALKRGGRTVAVIVPAPRIRYANRRPRRRRQGLTPDDPIMSIIGMFHDPDGPTDVSANRHKYLADAYDPAHQQ